MGNYTIMEDTTSPKRKRYRTVINGHAVLKMIQRNRVRTVLLIMIHNVTGGYGITGYLGSSSSCFPMRKHVLKTLCCA